MWYALRKLPQAGPDFAGSATELMRFSFRSLIVVTGIAYIAWHVISTTLWPVELGMGVCLVSPVALSTCALSLWLLRKSLLAANIVWHVGLAVAITEAVVTFRQPLVGLLFALLPLSAVVTAGWQAGLLMEGAVAALVWLLSHGQATWAVPAGYAVATISGGAFSGVLGWAAMRSLLTVTQWSLYSYDQARKKMDEARDQRVELKLVQEDLIHANRELARLSDRLQAAYQAAEEARRAKEEFVANVSHELRTPLNLILGFSEMITQSPQVYGTPVPTALLADISAIQRNSQHLAKLINDVLDLSQVQAGRMALSKEWCNLGKVIGEAAGVVQALFDSKGLYLQTEVPANLPPVLCDGTRIRQVVLNLLSNASRFTERGGVCIRVHATGQEIVASVADTGPGIAPHDQKKVFEPFQQVDGSIRRRYSGSGLGLSISKRFVEMHGGRMWFASEVGAGTTFCFSLPLAQAMPLDEAREGYQRGLSPDYEYRMRTRASKAPPPVLVPRFVILERGDSLQRLFARFMDHVEISPVRDIGAAVGELARSPARALIINAPSLGEVPDAREALAHLPLGTPTVTCWVPGEAEAAERLGVVRYLVKPVTGQALLSALADLGQGVRRVLVVDDEREFLRMSARILSSSPRGYQVLRATDGQRALSFLRERKPDVMLLDLIMPGMDGFRVLQEKSRDPSIRDIPVMVVSSLDPVDQPLVRNMLTVSRSGVLPVHDLLAGICALSEVLSPSS